MPNSSLDSPPHGVQQHYRLTHQEWVAHARVLRGAELRVLYYIRSLNPFNDTWMEINVTAIAEDLGIAKGTVSKALHRLASADLRLIELEIRTAYVRLVGCTPDSLEEPDAPWQASACPEYDTQASSPDHTSPANMVSRDDQDAPPIAYAGSSPPPYPAPVPRPQDPKQPPDLLHRISAAGIPINRTIRKAIAQLQQHYSAAAATQAVENALSALQEQQRVGTIRNLGGFFMAALRGGYTANATKRRRKEPHSRLDAPLSSSRCHPHTTPPPPADPSWKLPDWQAVEVAVDHALLAGDRLFALSRLRQLWEAGWHEALEQLCQMRRDWAFEVNSSGICDARAP